MREIDQNTEPVALPNQLHTLVGEAGAGIRRSWKLERNTLRVGVGPAPHDPQRSETAVVELFQGGNAGMNRLGALKMEYHGYHVFGQTLLQLGHGANDADLAAGLLFDSGESGHHVPCESVGVGRVQRRDLRGVRVRRSVRPGARLVTLYWWNEDGEEPTGKPAAARAR